MTTVLRVLLALSLLLGSPGDDEWWIDDPWACPEPDEPNCGGPGDVGGWPADAPPATPVDAPPAFTG